MWHPILGRDYIWGWNPFVGGARLMGRAVFWARIPFEGGTPFVVSVHLRKEPQLGGDLM